MRRRMIPSRFVICAGASNVFLQDRSERSETRNAIQDAPGNIMLVPSLPDGAVVRVGDVWNEHVPFGQRQRRNDSNEREEEQDEGVQKRVVIIFVRE